MPLCACLNTHGRLCSTSEVACSILCAVHVSDCGEGCMCYCDRQYWRISGCWRGLLYACDTWYCIPALDLFVCAETVHMLNGLQGWIKAFASVAITCIALQQVELIGLMYGAVLAVSAQYIQSMLLQRGSKTALLPLPLDIGLTAAAKLGSSMLEFAVLFTGQHFSSAIFASALPTLATCRSLG